MKISVQRVLMLMGVALPAGLLWAAREAVSWQPVPVFVPSKSNIYSDWVYDEHLLGQKGNWVMSRIVDLGSHTITLHWQNENTGASFKIPFDMRGGSVYFDAVALSPDGKICFYTTYTTKGKDVLRNLRSRLWHQSDATNKALSRIYFYDADFSTDGKRIDALSESIQRTQQFDSATGQLEGGVQLLPLPLCQSSIGNPLRFFREDEHEFWRIGQRGGARFLARLDLQTRHEILVPLAPGSSKDFQVSAHGHLLVGNKDDRFEMFDTSTGAKLWAHHFPGITELQLSPDERMCALCTGSRFEIYDARTGHLMRWLPFPPASRDAALEFQDFSFSPNSERLISSFRPLNVETPIHFSQRAR